jgi:hypothetical protein
MSVFKEKSGIFEGTIPFSEPAWTGCISVSSAFIDHSPKAIPIGIEMRSGGQLISKVCNFTFRTSVLNIPQF